MKTNRSPSIRSRLVLLTIACITPALFMAIMLISYNYQQAKAELIRNSISTARALSMAVDRDFASTESTLLALATSPHLTANKLAAFYSQANEVLVNRPNTNIALMDIDGKQYLNTSRPFGVALPPRSADARMKLVFETGQTVISDMFIGSVTKRPIVVVGVPVQRNNKVFYSLNAGISTKRFDDLLVQPALPSTWIGAILDESGTIVARTRALNQFIGKKGSPDLLNSIAQSMEGSFEGKTSEGTEVVAVFSRSEVTNWTVAIGIPIATLNNELWGRLSWLVFATSLLLAISLGLAWLIGGRLARSVRSLAAPALALGSGEPVTISAFNLREADEVGEALVKASVMLSHAQHRANHDVLTGLANRELFKEILNQQLAVCERLSSHLSVLYIDLDGFKGVNDLHGHATGDKLLRVVAERLKLSIRESDVAARLGGDEFSVLLLNAKTEEATVVAQKISASLEAAYQIDHLILKISASIGVAGYPQHGATGKVLLHSADDAMYRAKAEGKGKVR